MTYQATKREKLLSKLLNIINGLEDQMKDYTDKEFRANYCSELRCIITDKNNLIYAEVCWKDGSQLFDYFTKQELKNKKIKHYTDFTNIN